VKNRSATIYDSGNARFTVTTSTNTALAVVKALLKPEETANKHIFLSDFTTTPRAIISALEQATGEKFSITQKDGASELKSSRERYDNGEAVALYGILTVSFVGDVDIGYDFEREQVVWNEKLGLPKVRLEEVVEEAVALARTS
jgi:nucleoside-diphosphate-sugar epimerase